MLLKQASIVGYSSCLSKYGKELSVLGDDCQLIKVRMLYSWGEGSVYSGNK